VPGLKYDDVVMEENPTMQEVLRRLPREAVSEREFRYKRAFQASLMKGYVAETEQVKPEEDRPYLQHLLAEVRQEASERVQFDNAQRK
jgi:ubiquinol-cytochrome c reductase subunit 7